MKVWGFFRLVFFGTTLILGCAPPKAPLEGPSSYLASRNMASAFTVQKVTGAAGNGVAAAPPIQPEATKVHLSIRKDALEKEFLLQTQWIDQPLAPNFTGMQSRIVSFRQRGSQLYLVETSQGHNFASNLPQTLLLAEYPIVSESADDLQFDFNKGMSDLLVAFDWTGEESLPDGAVDSLKVRFSYIDDAGFPNPSVLTIKQVAQIVVGEDAGEATEVTAILQYSLSAYAPNPQFHPTIAPETLDRAGFFEVASLTNDQGGLTTYASKMDVSKPIVYAISANTPDEYKQAIRDGVLYWNRAFGKDVIQVIDAPKGATAPDPSYNIIQWVDWNTAGFAYADAQMDPRTGEILHQQVFLPSVFAVLAKQRGRILGRMAGLKTPQKHGIGLSGFKSQDLCALNVEDVAADSLNSLPLDLNETQVLKAAQDLLRSIVAHEVGHTLGLRHNFAGSLAANYALSQRTDLLKSYFQKGVSPDGLVVSSSVMEYQLTTEEFLQGDQIRRGLPAFAYDKKAIQMLYYGAHYLNVEMPLFCTDEDAHSRKFPDCRVFDAGASFVEWTAYDGRAMVERLPWILLEIFENAKDPWDGSQPIAVTDVTLNPKAYASLILYDEEAFLKLLFKDGQLLTNSRAFNVVDNSNSEAVHAIMEQELLSEILKQGGLSHVFLQTDMGFAGREFARFEDVLKAAGNLKGINVNGHPFEYSASEVAWIESKVKGFYLALQEELIQREVVILSGTTNEINEATIRRHSAKVVLKMEEPKFVAGALANSFAGYLSDRAEEYLLATNQSLVFTKVEAKPYWEVGGGKVTIPTEDQTATKYSLPVFTYPYRVREVAAGLLKADRSEDPSWGVAQRMALTKKYTEAISQAYGPADSMSDTSAETLNKGDVLPPALIGWLREVVSLEHLLKAE
jgi:hypothetical protein